MFVFCSDNEVNDDEYDNPNNHNHSNNNKDEQHERGVEGSEWKEDEWVWM